MVVTPNLIHIAAFLHLKMTIKDYKGKKNRENVKLHTTPLFYYIKSLLLLKSQLMRCAEV